MAANIGSKLVKSALKKNGSATGRTLEKGVSAKLPLGLSESDRHLLQAE